MRTHSSLAASASTPHPAMLRRGASAPAAPRGASPSGGRADAAPRTAPAPATAPPPPSRRTLAVGSVGLDLLAVVDAYPPPDAKVRTRSLTAQGGGNAANAATAAARLGAPAPALVSRVGGDGAAATIRAELIADGVGVEFVLGPVDAASASATPSPTTYIIVDAAAGTRTCLHTPGPSLARGDIEALRGGASPVAAAAAAAAVFFDGRLAEAALPIAEAAAASGVPILVEAERPREGLDSLLALATAVAASASYPRTATGRPGRGAASAALLAALPGVAWMTTTFGAEGAILMERVAEARAPPPFADADAAVEAALAAAAAARPDPAGRAAAATAPGGAAVGDPGMSAATLALDWDGAPSPLPVRLTAVSAASLPQGAVADTTGAGDAFNGALLFALATALPPARAARLGAVVAACAVTAVGARAGLPGAGAVRADLLR